MKGLDGGGGGWIEEDECKYSVVKFLQIKLNLE